MKTLKSLVILGILVVAAVPMFGQATATVTVQANVNRVCEWETATATLDFLTYDPIGGADATATAALRYRCTKSKTGESVDIAFVTDGLMNNGTDDLAYTLTNTDFTYAAATSGWQDLTLDGTVAGGQDVSDGSYLDTMTVVINY